MRRHDLNRLGRISATLLAVVIAFSGPPAAAQNGADWEHRRPWAESLERQLAELRARYWDRPLELVVIHHGIFNRADNAEQFAVALSKAIGKPVIALPTYQPLDKAGPDVRASDLPKVVGQYLRGNTRIRVDFVEAWDRILKDRPSSRIKQIVFHSGAGVNANTAERSEILAFLAEHPKMVDRMVFAMTDLKKTTVDELRAAGVEAVQINDFVGRLTRPAAEYIDPDGGFNPLAVKTIAGWALKLPLMLVADRGMHSLMVKDPVTGVKSVRAELLAALAGPGTPVAAPGSGGAPPETLGGIDLSAVEFRYLSEHTDGANQVMTAAFRGEADALHPHQGKRLAWDAFFTFLTLPDSTFWVNLHPNQPNRIIDARFGATWAGLVLLAADLRLKVDMGVLTHPRDSTVGRRFWAMLAADRERQQHLTGQAPSPSAASFRVWVVPGQAVVSATDETVYVVDASLEVMLESEFLGGDRNDPGEISYGESLLKAIVLPELRHRINHAPEYAELRQVFYARVVGEWYKTRGGGRGRGFSEMIDAGDAHSCCPPEPDAARVIFERFKSSLDHGEYHFTLAEREGNAVVSRTYFMGGVDLTSVRLTPVSLRFAESCRPDLGRVVIEAVASPGGHWTDQEVWLADTAIGPS